MQLHAVQATGSIEARLFSRYGMCRLRRLIALAEYLNTLAQSAEKTALPW